MDSSLINEIIQLFEPIGSVQTYPALPHPFPFGGPLPARPNLNSMETFQLKALPMVPGNPHITYWAIIKLGDPAFDFHFTLFSMGSITTIFDTKNETDVANIQWNVEGYKALVSAKGLFWPPMLADNFFQLSKDETYRDMYYAHRPYSWIPVEIKGSKSKSVFLYDRGESHERFHAKTEQARIYCHPVDGSLLFDITHKAIATGALVYFTDGPGLKLGCGDNCMPHCYFHF
ncbi:hypothetical protein BDN70DRAFT_899907 [Pholiota conissans]|uniref:Uncharacterized protein n=1 Tax=Pholiota conissans TaxID=109636 RepID=A0A9P6CNU9_9AGAR|nr:hypothetical protein BDN70DRAFT_899907 [Pholiota conissans]